MAKSRSALKVISKTSDNTHPSQQVFNELTKKVEKQKQSLLEWEQAIDHLWAKQNDLVIPALASLNAARSNIIKFLDSACEDMNPQLLTAKEKTFLRIFIIEASGELILDGYVDLKPIFDKYSETSFDYQRNEANELLHEDFKEVFGFIPPENMRFDSAEDVLRAVVENLKETRNPHDIPDLLKDMIDDADNDSGLKIDPEEELNQKSIQEIFRKLASILHPDRETDLAEKERKTALMQRVNIAYTNRDLLDLFKLQFEAEQIDPSDLDRLSEEKLIRYNNILHEQLDELKYQIQLAKEKTRMHFMFDRLPQSPKAALAMLEKNARSFIDLGKRTNDDLIKMQKDLRYFKSWIASMSVAHTQRMQEMDRELPQDLDFFHVKDAH